MLATFVINRIARPEFDQAKEPGTINSLRLLARGSGWMFAFIRFNGLAWLAYIFLAGIYLFDSGVI